MNKRIMILGGGISGLSLAWKLAEEGFAAEIIESQAKLGGLASTIKMDRYFLDYGPHFFLSNNQKILEKVNNLFKEEEMAIFKRNAKIYLNGRFLNYPLTAKNILLQMGIKVAFLSSVSYLRSKIEEKFKNLDSMDNNFEKWAINNFGRYLYKIFFKPYTEQFWGMPCNKLSSHSMPTHTKLSFFKTLKLLFVKDIVKSSLSLVERETTLPLHYPKSGIGELSKKMRQKIEEKNGKIYTGWTVERVERRQDDTFIVSALKDGKVKDFQADFLVSTIPLTDFVRLLEPSASQEVKDSLNNLNYLSLIVLYLVTDKKITLDSSYLYYVKRPYNRISEINKFCATLSPCDENMLALEISCHKKDAIWNYDKDELFELCIKFLEQDGIVKRNEVKNIFVLKAPNAYPIYLYNYQAHLNKVLDYIDQIENLEVLGRSGKYIYMDMDQAMEKAFSLAEQIMKK